MARQLGFTLLEMLLVVALVGIASFYMFGSLAMSNKAYVVVDQVSESQQGMRAVAQLMERDLRHAGKMVPLPAALCAADNQGSPDVLYVSDGDAVDPGDDFLPYEAAMVQSAVDNLNATGSTTVLVLDSLILEPAPPTRATYDVSGDGTNDSDFQLGGGAIIADLDSPTRGVTCGTIEAVNLGATSITIRTVSNVLNAASGSVRLVAVPAYEYRVANGDELQRNGDLMVKGVEDLQLAYFLDANDDDIVDPGEMHGSGAGTNANFDSQGADMRRLREVRINLVVRSRAEDPDFSGQRQTTENRTAGAGDGYRRRVYTSMVRPRNMVRRF